MLLPHAHVKYAGSAAQVDLDVLKELATAAGVIVVDPRPPKRRYTVAEAPHHVLVNQLLHEIQAARPEVRNIRLLGRKIRVRPAAGVAESRAGASIGGVVVRQLRR